jgi:hypothetical protein
MVPGRPHFITETTRRHDPVRRHVLSGGVLALLYDLPEQHSMKQLLLALRVATSRRNTAPPACPSPQAVVASGTQL